MKEIQELIEKINEIKYKKCDTIVNIDKEEVESNILASKKKEKNIKPEVVDPDDVEMLQDLIITCVNDALKKVDEAQSAQFGKYNVPGLM